MRNKAFATIALMFTALLVCSTMGQAALPLHSASDVLVTGPNENFLVTILVMSRDNATYHVEIAETEDVTENFNLLNEGKSENKTLANGVTYNFTVPLVALDAAAGTTQKVGYEVYMNSVLISTGTVNITVQNPMPDAPQDLCSVCSFYIPLIIVGSLFIVVRRGHKRKVEE
jgi:hypothetical protein